MGQFRFENLEIWKTACRIGDELDVLADRLDKEGKRRYAEQLRGALLSVSNNIAEGSASSSKKDFLNFLNIARRSAAETANIVLFLERRKVVPRSFSVSVCDELRALSAQITSFGKVLGKDCGSAS